jgi:hypothetical protein
MHTISTRQSGRCVILYHMCFRGVPALSRFLAIWTFQEALAPAELAFFDHGWVTMGTRESPSGATLSATSIQGNDFKDVKCESVAKRMSWAWKGETTREEDMTYCLLGLFDVNMPLLYGEGSERAFLRLQLKVLQDSDDESIFAWMRDGAPSGLLGRLCAFLYVIAL